MISMNMIKQYREAFPDDHCFISEPGEQIIISAHNSWHTFISPFQGEDDKTFLDRIERSTRDGTNYFYTEWEIFTPSPDCIY